MSAALKRRAGCKALLSSLFLWAACVAQAQPLAQGMPQTDAINPTIAIIIDDMGNQQQQGLKAIHLPAPMTLAFLPGRPHTQKQARLAHQYGHEVMLHAPMENMRQLPLGAMALTSRMPDAELTSTLRQAIDSIPHISGVNNHMGSLLTSSPRAMNTVMQEIQKHPLYFVDSRTAASSVAYESARQHKIPSLTRDIFLDHEISYRAIHNQFQRLLSIARKKGTAIAIGHPHKETLRYLEKALPRLGQQGINVATVKGIWAIRHQGEQLFAPPGRTRTVVAQAPEAEERP